MPSGPIARAVFNYLDPGCLVDALLAEGSEIGSGQVAFTVEGERQRPVPTLILGLHGSACDSFGAAPCMLALTWDGEKLIHYREPLPEDDTPEN